MKALKVYTGILIMVCLSILSACSDNITSPVSSGSQETEVFKAVNTKNLDSYSSLISVKPGESIFLHSDITNLKSITDYSISNCETFTKNLFISASNIDGSQSLPCSSNGYSLDDLLIENRSGQEKTFEVKLSGESSK
jgi:hypothetical protein